MQDEQSTEKVRRNKMKLSQLETVKKVKYTKIKKRQEDENENFSDSLHKINFNSLQVQTLRKYKKIYKLKTAGFNKNQLLDVISKHFTTIPVEKEKEIIAYFIYNVKNSENHDVDD